MKCYSHAIWDNERKAQSTASLNFSKFTIIRTTNLFKFAQNFSIGFNSGEYGGKYKTLHLASIIIVMPVDARNEKTL